MVANHTTLFVVLVGAAAVGLLVALGGLLMVWRDASEFYEVKMDEILEFKQFSTDAWEVLVQTAPATGNKKPVKMTTSAGRLPFIYRKKRSAEDVCSCVESAQLCPAGTTGAPGAPGADGAPGEKGAQGAPGIDYATAFAAGVHVPGSLPIRKRDKGAGNGRRCFTCPPGTPGRPGPDGRNGAPGRPGMPGRRGAPGRHGMKGEKGEMGAAGEAGPRGPPGVRGHPGQKGIRGVALPGRTGPRGLLGQRGKPGKNGLIGVPGTHGKPGKKGPAGLPGTPGKDGATGPEGYPGLPGQDSDYCVCPERKDESSKKGSTAAPYLLKVDVSEPLNYKRRETTAYSPPGFPPQIVIASEFTQEKFSEPITKKPRRRHAKKGFGNGKRSVPASPALVNHQQRPFTITEFAGAA